MHDPGRSDCRHLFERLSEYMDGELPEAVCARFERHFRDCPRCVEFVEQMRRAVRLVESSPGPGLPEDIRRRILSRESASKAGTDARRTIAMKRMRVNAWLRLVAGFFVMVSVLLGYTVDARFYLFTAFVGLNLFQSAFTGWCPMISLLRRLGVPD